MLKISVLVINHGCQRDERVIGQVALELLVREAWPKKHLHVVRQQS